MQLVPLSNSSKNILKLTTLPKPLSMFPNIVHIFATRIENVGWGSYEQSFNILLHSHLYR